ncbi:MAG: LysM peptidoglycan-binding domain-containing protein, partial [Kingella sp. (in: b-proteobacteria)]
LDIMAAAHLANISESEFLALNPAFKTPVFIPKGNRQMLLPVHAVKTFERNYKDSDKNTLLSWDVFTPDSRMLLSDIAAQTGNSVSELQRLNGISGSFVNAGRSILVNKGKASNIGSFIDFTKADFDPIPDTFMEQAPVLSQNNLIAATKPVTQPVFVQTSITTPKEASASNDVVTQIATAPVQPSPETKPIVETTTVQTAAITVGQPQTDFVAQTVAASIAQPETNIAQTSTEPIAAPEENDALLQLAITSQERIRAAEAVRESLAQSDAAEEKLRLANEKRLASEAKKKQQLAATEKAKAEALAKAKPSTHKVGNGETLYSIAKQYNLNVADLVAGNHLKGNSIQKGQVLKVSFDKKDKTQPIKAVEKKSDKHKNTIPVSYTVRKGDTLQTIAERYNLKVADIKKLNKGSNNIKAGQTLKLGAS